MTEKNLSKNVPYYHSHFLNYYTQNNDNDKILDPISSIVRLALLRYKISGTKISVESNRIIYNKPNTWAFENLINYQGFYRGIFGYSRLDLVLLYPPILRAMYWFLNLKIENESDIMQSIDENESKNEDNHNNVKNILKIGKSGLVLLKDLYEQNDGRTELFLNHCISKINSCLDNTFECDALDNQIVLDERINFNLFNTIKMLWSNKEIKIISDKLSDIEEHLQKHKTLECQAVQKYISMINEILEEKDNEFKNMLVFNKVGNQVLKN